MNGPTPRQIELLLGGYATGTLSAEEHAALMRAALEDQALFDALMDEEALRETLSHPATRDELLRALRPAEVKAKWWHKPWPWAALATAMVAIAVLVVVRKEPELQTAKLESAALPATMAHAPKAEPVPSELALPKKLQMHDAAPAPAPVSTPAPAAPPAQAAAGNLAPAAAPMAQAAPPPPPRRNEDARLDQVAAADKSAGAVATAKKEVKQDFAAPVAETVALSSTDQSPLRITIAFQQQDGTWRDLPPNAAAPAGRTLRLTVYSNQRGALSTDPPVAAAQLVEPNRPATLLIAARASGDLSFRVNLREAPLAMPPGASALTMSRARQNAPRPEERAKARTAEADAAAAPAPARTQPILATQEIRIKIQ